MPELPEVETVRRGLAAALEGRRVTRVVARRPDLRLPLPADLAQRLAGRRFDRVGRRAKYLLLQLDDGQVLLVHLGMSGRIRLCDGETPLGPHDHVSIHVAGAEGGVEMRFTDARRFGLLALADAGGLDDHPLLARLGLEPLANGFDGRSLAAALKGRRAPIKAALLDQRTVAGLGNIYASEALFRARLSPRRRAATVQGQRAERLAAAIRAVLTEAIEAGGSSLRDYARPGGELGYFQHRWAVYGREGLPCPGCDCQAAGGGIRRIVQSGRATFYCPKRQR